MDNIPTWIAITSSLACGIIVAVLVQLYVVPWQRKKIVSEKKARFQVGLGDETDGDSSSNSSPRRAKKNLPVITESTELVLLNQKQNGGLMKKLSADLTPINNGYAMPKIDPKIVEKTENLLSKNSLDNTDLTITSLNFIDEQNSNYRNLKHIYDRTNQKSPETIIKYAFSRLE